MRKDKTTYFIIMIAAIVLLWVSSIHSKAEIEIGRIPGYPYSAELNEVMDSSTQMYLYDLCEKYGVEYALALAVIDLESSFNANAYNKNTIDRGLMQVNKQWVDDFQKMGWITTAQDLYQPIANIRCGMYLLSMAVEKYGNTEHAYAYYNTGNPSVNSNKASREVMRRYEIWKGRLQ